MFAALAATAALIVGSAGSSSAAAPALQAYGISSDGRLMAAFWTNTPQVLDWVRSAGPFCSGESFLIGIDFRVQDGRLYAVGNRGCVYTVSLLAGAEGTLTKVSQLTIALHGTTFGVDFNPAADRLRIISDTGQNLRHDLNTHTTVADTVLTTPPSTAPATGVTAAVYTNNDLNATTGTTLFDVNTSTDQVVIQSPANNGLLVPTGSLGVDAALNAGFDIFSDLSNGKTVSVSGFGTFIPPSGFATLYTVDLLTGATVSVGQFPLQITDIAVALDTN